MIEMFPKLIHILESNPTYIFLFGVIYAILIMVGFTIIHNKENYKYDLENIDHEEVQKILKSPDVKETLARISSPVNVSVGMTENVKDLLNKAIGSGEGMVLIDSKTDIKHKKDIHCDKRRR